MANLVIESLGLIKNIFRPLVPYTIETLIILCFEPISIRC